MHVLPGFSDCGSYSSHLVLALLFEKMFVYLSLFNFFGCTGTLLRCTGLVALLTHGILAP